MIETRRYLIPFRTLLLPHILTDTLVIGSGVGGLRAAIAAADHGDVIVLAKDAVDVSSTAWAQGGIAAVLSSDGGDGGDSIESHGQDTIDAGAGLCDPEIVRTLVSEGPSCVEELVEWGMRLDRDDGGHLCRGLEGGHRQSRIVHSDGDTTGAELVRCLLETVRRRAAIRLFDRCFVVDLLSASGDDGRGDPRVLGAITFHPRYGLQVIWSRATILACGGAGQVYRETTNPRVATGDGLALAWRAGATLADLEFTQFHPTTLYVAGAARALISEAVRGEGALLIDRDGHRFMDGVHEMGELAPRDVVSRAIADHLARTRQPFVHLDCRSFPAGRFAERFPALARMLQAYDIDPQRDLVPVQPAAHYTIGGVWTDADGRTSLPGLYACGETACSGLHGANRLASNSLLEGLVFGRRAGRATREMENASRSPIQVISDIRLSDHGELDLVDVRSSLRSAMWRNVGIERNGPKLADVIEMFAFWSRYVLDKILDEPDGWETQNMLVVGALMTRAAAWRRESRGTHCRLDHPAEDPARRGHALWSPESVEPRFLPASEPVEIDA